MKLPSLCSYGRVKTCLQGPVTLFQLCKHCELWDGPQTHQYENEIMMCSLKHSQDDISHSLNGRCGMCSKPLMQLVDNAIQFQFGDGAEVRHPCPHLMDIITARRQQRDVVMADAE